MIMNAPANNPWVQEDLQNGWTKREDVVAEPPQELDFVLDSMGISRSYIDVKPAYWNQDKTFVDADGKPDTPATLGYYHNKMIPSSGTIIAEANYSPKFKAPNQPLPPLNRWSDIVWLSWLAEAGSEASNLILILRNNIITQPTPLGPMISNSRGLGSRMILGARRRGKRSWLRAMGKEERMC
ncbi:MAG: hypothetical protein Q9198_009080 [Flavoplaca austrocitrina]